MKNWKIPAIIGGGLLLIIMILGGTYNGLVTSHESVNTAWSKVETQYQRRSDLIPNLVSTVKGAANFEQETLTKVIDARSKATQIKVDANNPDDIAKFQAAQKEVSSSLSRLLAVAENYPQLKATDNFKDLQYQLEGTENRITVARNDFNNEAKSYNTKVKSFPTNLLAGMFGFKERPYFEAEAGSEKTPTVNFGGSEKPNENSSAKPETTPSAQ